MIVNLVGPPCGGKSTFASEFVLRHPYFTYCPIDTYRAEYSCEQAAWAALAKDINEAEDVIIESCGFSWQLEFVLEGKDVYTIYMGAGEDELLRRLSERQKKREIPFEYEFSDEVETLLWIMQRVRALDWPNWARPDFVHFNGHLDPKDSYLRISTRILAERMARKQQTGESSDYRSESVSSQEGSREDQG